MWEHHTKQLSFHYEEATIWCGVTEGIGTVNGAYCSDYSNVLNVMDVI
jgi:hypothetical protein